MKGKKFKRAPLNRQGSSKSIRSTKSSRRRTKHNKQAEIRRLYELKKYEVIPMTTGLSLILNIHCVHAAW